MKYLILILLFNSCKNVTKGPFAIRDFNKSLQLHLKEIVSKGIVMYSDSIVRYCTTDEELMKLSLSEHPLIRATAFREILRRPSFDHLKILMNNLADTASITIDLGEWGTKYSTVSDDILNTGRWKNQDDKNRTINEVITRHNYLKAAYAIISEIEPQEKYYSYIKEMATRKLPFGHIEGALYALAKFKNSEDITLIKSVLLHNCFQLNSTSFQLLKEFPNDAYIDVFEKYYPQYFYHRICKDRDISTAIDFIESLASYTCKPGLRILDSILNKKPFISCWIVDSSDLKESLIYAIWNNPWEGYANIKKQVEKRVKQYEKRNKENEKVGEFKPGVIYPDSSKENIQW